MANVPGCSTQIGHQRNFLFTVNGTTPADRSAFSCNSRITNIAVTNSPTPGLDLANNLSIATTFFDRSIVPTSEICGNGIDDNCDGRFDCADPVCNCFPQLPTAGGGFQCFGGLAAIPIPTGGAIITDGCVAINVVNSGLRKVRNRDAMYPCSE